MYSSRESSWDFSLKIKQKAKVDFKSRFTIIFESSHKINPAQAKRELSAHHEQHSYCNPTSHILLFLLYIYIAKLQEWQKVRDYK